MEDGPGFVCRLIEISLEDLEYIFNSIKVKLEFSTTYFDRNDGPDFITFGKFLKIRNFNSNDFSLSLDPLCDICVQSCVVKRIETAYHYLTVEGLINI